MKATDKTLNDSITALTGRVTTLEGELENAKNNIGSVSTALTQEIADRQADIKTLQDKDTELKNQITALETALSDKEQGIKDWANGAFVTVAAWNEFKTQINTTIAGLTSKIEALESSVGKINATLEEMLPPLEAAELKELRTRITTDYDVRRAAMFLKLLRYSYSSGGKSFASQPFDIRKLFGLIKELEARMANVVVENQDFETLIKHYDRPDTFFYADPPYYSTEDMYAVGFNWSDHVRLRNTLADIKGKFLLSYNDCPEIRELYKDFSLFDFSRTHSMAQRYEAGKEFKELYQNAYSNRSWAASMGAFRLFHHLARLIQNKIDDEKKGKFSLADRKLRRMINEKKEAQGLRLE